MHYDNVLRLLDSHHTGEDELLTPKLDARSVTGTRFSRETRSADRSLCPSAARPQHDHYLERARPEGLYCGGV